MELMLLHNRYQLAGGEDGVVQAEKSLLEINGHQVSLVEVSNHDIASPWDKVTAAANAIYSTSTKQRVSELIANSRPDVVHVHNFFPLLSPSVYDACKKYHVPVIQTLHNYRLACPKAIPFRDGKICEDCIGKTVPLPGVIHGCYRQSRLQSSVVAAMLTLHRLRGTWQQMVDAYIVFTQFQKEKMIQAGLPSEKIYIKPNFIFANQPPQQSTKSREYLLFVGRLSPEKGVSVLIDAYINQQLSIPLKIVGDGPLLPEFQEKIRHTQAQHLIEFLGYQNKENILNLMRNARLLVFPSVWYEGFPLTIAEAFACGLPVLTSKVGGLTEIVSSGVNGLYFNVGDSTELATKVQWAIANPQEIDTMANNARREYETKYTPEVNYRQLLDIYQKVSS